MVVLITTQKIEIMAAQKAKPEKLEYDQWMFGWCACKRALNVARVRARIENCAFVMKMRLILKAAPINTIN